MVTEQDKTLKALQIAIQMEKDGQEFYHTMSQQSGNRLGKKLLEALAAEEEHHLQRFEEIYNSLRNRKAWPVTQFQPNAGQMLRSIFARASEEMIAGEKAANTEVDAVKTALDMENRSYDFYKQQETSAGYQAEREYYRSLAAEEWEHHLALLDYYEYLEDPAAWFVSKEHPSLDGS